jgi:hypothetical protein
MLAHVNGGNEGGGALAALAKPAGLQGSLVDNPW